MLLKVLLVAASLAAFSAYSAVRGAPSFVQYQEWFSNYSALGEQSMQLKRAYNSNKTLHFNKLLLPILANGTVELRRVNAAAWNDIENAETENEDCLSLVHDLFEIYTLFAVEDMHDCVRNASDRLTPLTTDDFFRYTNFVSRELSRITHASLEAIATYSKILEMDNVNGMLEQSYYDFNWMYNTYQTVINEELNRFRDDHPILKDLEECVQQTVYWHESDLFYVVSYLEWYCNAAGQGGSKQ
ncbi:hypothetical protein RP20_CCG002080 [Aedes albopictus]|nr:hypothetical protein RP20_CCG002080 [Aedes albopictus]